MTSTGTASWRSATAIRTALVAALVGAVGIGSYAFAYESISGEKLTIGPSSSATNGEGDGETDPTTSTVDAAPFTTADAGTCLTWDVSDQGALQNFERTSCEETHRFEVSTREDLATYPASEFGADAERPDITRQAQLREELCQAPTTRYLDGRFDPAGRYSIASILPPQEKWEAGDRTLLCGVQATDSEGNVIETEGYVAEQDQARTVEAGECVRIGGAEQLFTVDCAEPHQLEATSTVNLWEVFPDSTPSIEEQDEHLEEVCTEAAISFLGEEEALYQSTLQPYWIPLQPASWAGGSHSTNCFLTHATEEGGFSELVGSATEGNEGFTIDGENPPPQPEREPLPPEDPEAGDGADAGADVPAEGQ